MDRGSSWWVSTRKVNNMNMILKATLALGLAIGLAGCGSSNDGTVPVQGARITSFGGKDYRVFQPDPKKDEYNIELDDKWYPCANGNDCVATIVKMKGKKPVATGKKLPASGGMSNEPGPGDGGGC